MSQRKRSVVIKCYVAFSRLSLLFLLSNKLWLTSKNIRADKFPSWVQLFFFLFTFILIASISHSFILIINNSYTFTDCFFQFNFCLSQIVLCWSQRGPPPQSAGHDSLKTLHSHSCSALYCEYYTPLYGLHQISQFWYSVITTNHQTICLELYFLPVLQCLSTLLMLCTSDMYTLINYVGFINYLFYGVTVAGQIVLRIKQPDMHRPIKVCWHGVFVSVLLCLLPFFYIMHHI